MALRAEPALNQVIWLSLKVWFTWELVGGSIGLLANDRQGLARLEVCQALDADPVEGADLQCTHIALSRSAASFVLLRDTATPCTLACFEHASA